MEANMNKIKQIFTNYQLPMFFLLTYLLSWWTAPLLQGGIFPYGPALAAWIVLAGSTDWQELRNLKSRITRWRVAWNWYAIGPTIMLFSQGFAYLLIVQLGAPVMEPPHLPSAGAIVSILLLGGCWEEIGWSGYALPKLQGRFTDRSEGKYLAALILGIFRAIWHLPLFISGTIFWFDIFVFNIAFQLLISWVFNRSSGSVPVVMLLHFFSNFIGLVFYPVFAADARANYYALFMGLESLIALWMIWKFGLGLEKNYSVYRET
jgi:membrane protease YdiL (CAAX protease family)